jgi:type IV secretory pathway VirB2 component (pilin)
MRRLTRALHGLVVAAEAGAVVATVLAFNGPLWAATSGTPLDTVYTQATTMFNGPIAGLLILAGLAVVALMFMMGRGLEGFGFWSGVGMIIGGTFIASAVLFMTYFFPTAGALIR